MRHSYRPAGSGLSPQNAGMRIGSMICLLLVVGMLYSRARKPETWAWLANETGESQPAAEADKSKPPAEEKPGKSAAPRSPDAADKKSAEKAPAGAVPVAANPDKLAAPKPPEFQDTIIAGPTDQDADEQADVRSQFEVITDREELDALEMPAYWRLFRWAWAQSFADMEKRALRDVMYVQLWDKPDKYRGKLIRLKLHIVRIVKWDAEENRGKFKHIYEVWGATEDSQSFPYVAVVSELPPGMKPGATVRYDGIFVGYFLKNMAYKTHKERRGSPLLIGRLHALKSASVSQNQTSDTSLEWKWLSGLALVGIAGLWFWFRFARSSKPETVVTPRAEAEMEAWLQDAPTPPLEPLNEFQSPPTEPLQTGHLAVTDPTSTQPIRGDDKPPNG